MMSHYGVLDNLIDIMELKLGRRQLMWYSEVQM